MVIACSDREKHHWNARPEHTAVDKANLGTIMRSSLQFASESSEKKKA
jgi:hypothetical protein